MNHNQSYYGEIVKEFKGYEFQKFDKCWFTERLFASEWSHCYFENCVFEDCDFGLLSKMICCRFHNCSFKNCSFAGYLRLKDCSVSYCQFEDCDLRGMEIDGTRLQTVILKLCDFVNVKAKYSAFDECNFEECSNLSSSAFGRCTSLTFSRFTLCDGLPNLWLGRCLDQMKLFLDRLDNLSSIAGVPSNRFTRYLLDKFEDGCVDGTVYTGSAKCFFGWASAFVIENNLSDKFDGIDKYDGCEPVEQLFYSIDGCNGEYVIELVIDVLKGRLHNAT